MPYTLAIHRGGPDGGNPHAHLMVSERGLDGHERSREQWFRRYNAKAPEKGGAKKSRTMMSREWVKDTREAWAREANEALERAGREERVDHRSLASLREATTEFDWSDLRGFSCRFEIDQALRYCFPISQSS